MIKISALASRISSSRKFRKTISNEPGYHIRKNKVYYCRSVVAPALRVVAGADPPTFTVLGYGLARDCNHIYMAHKAVSDDPEHFTILDGHLSKDSKRVYYADRIISHDAPNFHLLAQIDGFAYFRDQNSIFLNGVRLDDPDIASFEPLRHGYSIDCARVYLMGTAALKVIEGADPYSFQVINQYYSLDNKHVYWRGARLTECEPSILEALDSEV